MSPPIDNMRQHAGRDAGHTFVELTVVLAVLTLLIAIVANLVVQTTENQNYTDRLARATEIHLDLLAGMRDELVSSVTLFENNSFGTAYLAALELDPAATPTSYQVLPTIDSGGIFEKETTSGSRTGNSLFFARHAWTTEFECTSLERYRVDVYRLMYYYLTPEDGGPTPGSSIGLNLALYVSEPLADGAQIDRITDPADHAEVLTHLYDATADVTGESFESVEIVWRPDGDPSTVGTFRQFNPGDSTLSDTPLTPRTLPWKIQRDPALADPSLLYYRHFSVVSNYARRSWGIGRFGLIDNSGAGFPHGLEVQIVGPTSGRKVLLHMTIASTNRSGHKAHSDARTIVFVDDV